MLPEVEQDYDFSNWEVAEDIDSCFDYYSNLTRNQILEMLEGSWERTFKAIDVPYAGVVYLPIAERDGIPTRSPFEGYPNITTTTTTTPLCTPFRDRLTRRPEPHIHYGLGVPSRVWRDAIDAEWLDE